MKKQVEQTIKRYHMLEQGESVAVGLSGGADSVALLLCLHEWAKAHRGKLSAIHVNHNLRGEASDGDEEFVRQLCQRLAIPLQVHSLPIRQLADELGLSVEECAREQRYRLFSQSETDKIATAHTLSDSVETTLFHLTRGTGLDGLTGIPPVRQNIIRPLIHNSRQEVENFLETRGQSYRVDSTNLSPEYTRNFIRLEIIPRLEKINPRLERGIGNLQQLLTEDANFLEELTIKALEQITLGAGIYSCREFLAQPAPLRGRLLRRLLREQKQEYGKERIDLLTEIISQGRGKLQLSKDLFCKITTENFTFAKPPCLEKPFEVSCEIPKGQSRARIPIFFGKTVYLYRIDYEEFENITKKNPQHLKNVVDYDKIEDRLLFRSRRFGDRYQPYRRGCTKTLKDLFSEAKRTLEERSRTVILSGPENIHWVEGFGASQEAAVLPTTKNILLIMTKKGVQ